MWNLKTSRLILHAFYVHVFCSEVKDSSKKPDPAESAPVCLDSQLQKGQWKALYVSYIFLSFTISQDLIILRYTMGPKMFLDTHKSHNQCDDLLYINDGLSV